MTVETDYFFDHTYNGPAHPLLGDKILWEDTETIFGAFHVDLWLMDDAIVIGEGGKRWLVPEAHLGGLERA